MNNTARVDYIDIAKGIGIIMVVLGHAYLLPVSVFKVIFSVHMPLFFILSGYVFHYRPGDSFRRFMKKNVRSLLLPYALTSVFIILLKMAAALVTGKNVWEQLRIWFFSALYGSGARIPSAWSGEVFSIGVIWFLLALFTGRTLLALILHSRLPWLWALILFFASYISTDWFWLPFSIQPGCCSVVFLYLGYEIQRHDMFAWDKRKIAVLIPAAAVWTYCMIHCGILCMVENVYKNTILDLIGAVCGTMVIVFLARFIECRINVLRKPLAALGRISLGVMCAHLVVLTCWPRSWVITFLQEHFSWPSWVCDAIDVALITAAVTAVFYVIPPLRRTMMPGAKKA